MEDFLDILKKTENTSHVISGIPFTFSQNDFIPVKIIVKENGFYISSLVSNLSLTIPKNNFTVSEKDDYFIVESLNSRFILKLNVTWETKEAVKSEDIIVNAEPLKKPRKPKAKKPLTKK